MYVPVLEGVVYLLVETLLDLLAQHVDVGFVDVLAFFNEGDGVVDVDVGELGLFLLPVFI